VLQPRRLPPTSDLDERPLADGDVEAGEHVEARRLVAPDLAGAILRDVGFEEVRVEGGDLSGARLEGGRLIDTVLEGTNLANLRARGAALTRVQLRGCRMTGLQWTEGTWRDVLVADCRADLCALRATRLERVTFRDCVLTEADLVDVQLRDVHFERCSLVGADLSGARFQRCEMRGCDLEGLRGVERLRGVAMPWPDVVQSAGLFAEAVGVQILDD
jgi:uncharacterized protein YjbI with pentapeptide repeats